MSRIGDIAERVAADAMSIEELRKEVEALARMARGARGDEERYEELVQMGMEICRNFVRVNGARY